jgi:hypothetical protein
LTLVNAGSPQLAHRVNLVLSYSIPTGGIAMTEHLRIEDTLDDQRAMRRLAFVVACFLAFTAAMAIGVGIALG